MPEEITPGVYIEENSHFPPHVAEVKSSVPAFVGYTEKAKALNGDDLSFVPQKIFSLVEYEQLYGFATPYLLYQALQLYFSNGGSPCYIVSIGDYNNVMQKADFIRGLDSLNRNDEVTLLLFPDAVNLPGTDLYEVQRTALKQAAELGDRFCILDLKMALTRDEHRAMVNEFRVNIGINDLKFGAAYTPYLKTSASTQALVPPSAAIAGVYCSIDQNRGVWKAPANISLNNVTELAYNINDNEQDELNVDTTAGKSVNVIRKFIGKGVVVWGARTLAGNDNEWRYVSVRRFFIMIEESVKKACLSFIFEPNDANTWVKVKGMIENYLTVKWREGALQGTKPEHAFFVHAGLGQTMTAMDIQEGRLIVEIGMAAVRPAEFIILRFSQKMATD